MITVKIDEDACVGCTLCVDECPTDVFEFDDVKKIPVVTREKECFGCFSCSEICPAEAIVHGDAVISNNFYHDSYSLDLAAKLTPGISQVMDVTDEAERRTALDDLGIRLLSIASVFRHTLGGSMPAVGTMAGRTLATQLPRYQEPESLQEVFELCVKQYGPSWDLDFVLEGESLVITTKSCFIRELCEREGIELGGDLCVLFYNNLAGYLGKMGDIRLKLEEMKPGCDKCTYQVKTFQRKKR